MFAAGCGSSKGLITACDYPETMCSDFVFTDARPYTLADWEALVEAPAGHRVELIGGRLEAVPVPGMAHQIFRDEFLFFLRRALRSGRGDLLAITAVGVSVVEGMGFIPDVVVVPLQRDGAVKVCAADLRLVIEVVSPRTREHDRMVKPAAYAQAGVPFYWRVEPIPGAPPAVFCFQLSAGHYAESAVVESGRPATVKAAPVDVDLDVDVLYEQIFGGWSH